MVMPLLPMRRVAQGESVFRRGITFWVNELTGEERVYMSPGDAANFPVEECAVTDAVLSPRRARREEVSPLR